MKQQTKSIVIFTVVVGGMVAIGGCGGHVPAPTSFGSYNAKDGTFQCDYPKGWKASGGGKGYQWAKFGSGSAEIKISANVTGSLLGDIAKSRTAPLGADEIDERFAPVAQVHEWEKERVAKDMTDYEEQPPQVIKPKLGDGRKSEFTAAGGFGTKIHGYRVTILAHDKRVQVICTCPETNWSTLQGAFDRVIDSLARGEAQR